MRYDSPATVRYAEQSHLKRLTGLERVEESEQFRNIGCVPLNGYVPCKSTNDGAVEGTDNKWVTNTVHVDDDLIEVLVDRGHGSIEAPRPNAKVIGSNRWCRWRAADRSSNAKLDADEQCVR